MKRKPKKKSYGSVDELVTETFGKTFIAYWNEQRRHEDALRKIFAKDKKHICKPEVVGHVRMAESQRVMLTFRRCAICMKDMPDTKPEK